MPRVVLSEVLMDGQYPEFVFNYEGLLLRRWPSRFCGSTIL